MIRPMKSYDVIRRAVDEPGVKSVAAALKVSAALVYKWCEPPAGESDTEQSGTKNPLDRVTELYATTKDLHLIRYLCNQAGGYFVANPIPPERPDMDRNLNRETRMVVRDFSELLESVTLSVEDDHQIDVKEADTIRQRWEDLKANVERFVVACERGHFQVSNKTK